jgi:hypothetical protein
MVKKEGDFFENGISKRRFLGLGIFWNLTNSSIQEIEEKENQTKEDILR